MEKDDMVRMAEKCPYCGSTSLYRRIRLGGYRCLKSYIRQVDNRD